MKYWRGFVVAIILSAITFGLVQFSAGHIALVDMIYPYVTRLIQSFLADWSAGATYCLWQLFLLVLGLAILAGIVLMLVLRLNPIQLIGWITAGASLIFLLHTGLYGLNHHAGPLAEDIRMDVNYTLSQLVDATEYYRDEAGKLADQIKRNPDGTPNYPAFEELAVQAAEGFRVLTYEDAISIFAGSTVPVKKLGWSEKFTAAGVTGVTMPITGESAVNPDIPAISIPFAMCEEMSHRMSIVNEEDARFAAFLACDANPSVEFRYSGYFMAFYHCLRALENDPSSAAQSALSQLRTGIAEQLALDLAEYESFWLLYLDENAQAQAAELKDTYYSALLISPDLSIQDWFVNLFQGPTDEEATETTEATDPTTPTGEDTDGGETANDTPVKHTLPELLTSWHVKEIVLPSLVVEEDPFDPYDESAVDLTTPGEVAP